MRNYGLLAAATGLIFIAACRESESQQLKRAQLVGQENLQLKKEIQEKDRQIEGLKKDMELQAQQHAEEVEKTSQSVEQLMKIMMQTNKELEECRQKTGTASETP